MRTATHFGCLFAGTCLAFLQVSPAGTGQLVWTFDRDAVGKIAAGFKEEVGEWRIVDDAGKKVLAQQAQNDDPIFNVVLVTNSDAQDLDLSVRLKAVAGKFDQGGGLVWRAKDKNNYYIARYNPLEDNFRLYKVQNGKRTMFQNADIPHTPGWHTLRITMQGRHIECFYDGKKHFEFNDRTFPYAGRIGLWSKADAQTEFDDLALTPIKPAPSTGSKAGGKP